MVEIFGTLGPACAKESILAAMLENGMSGIRLNLSHSSLMQSEQWLLELENACHKTNRKCDLLIDMQGSEIRTGKIPDQILKENQTLSLDALKLSEKVMQEIHTGDVLLIDDGKIQMRIQDNTHAFVERGGTLSAHKSVKVEDKDIAGPALTKEDIENLKNADKYGVNALMEPFVTSSKQLKEIRRTLHDMNEDHIRIFAKIESREGIRHLDEIMPEADMIVIARGDLGNDMPLWKLPLAQQEIEDACKKAHKPFMVVTEMLASMLDNPRPTRAEVSDIFHAVKDGADALMLTNETAVGKYPAEAISYLFKTASEAERYHI